MLMVVMAFWIMSKGEKKLKIYVEIQRNFGRKREDCDLNLGFRGSFTVFA